jgi:hypothetical protein
VLRKGSASRYDAGPSTGGTELVIKGKGLGHELGPVHRRRSGREDLRLLDQDGIHAGQGDRGSVSPASGKAGTKVTISGANLGFIEAVYFGKIKVKTFASVPALLDCGSTFQVTAVVPPGKAGSKVEIRVVTLESEVIGSGKSAPTRRRLSRTAPNVSAR